MRQQYRRQSFSAWVFWGALVIGGTLYGAYRFDWFPVGFPSPRRPRRKRQARKKRPWPRRRRRNRLRTDKSKSRKVPAGPQSEPPPSEFDEPAVAKSEIANSTKARLMEQRAEGPTPKLHSNAADRVDSRAGQMADSTAVQPRFTPSATVKATVAEVTPCDSSGTERPRLRASRRPNRRPSPIVQTVNVADEKEAAPIDPELEAHLEKIDHFLQNSDFLRAHRELSTLYWAKPRWRSAIKERIEKTANAIYFDPSLNSCSRTSSSRTTSSPSLPSDTTCRGNTWPSSTTSTRRKFSPASSSK